VIRAPIANQQNPAPPQLVNQAMDPAMQQFFEAQMQLIQNFTNTVQQMQAQQNQPPQLAPQPPRDRHKEFMSHNPPTFSHSTDPLDADDWLKTVTKKLEIVGMHTPLHIPTGTTSLGKSFGTTSALITSLQG
jgi:hypothetical protein